MVRELEQRLQRYMQQAHGKKTSSVEGFPAKSSRKQRSPEQLWKEIDSLRGEVRELRKLVERALRRDR